MKIIYAELLLVAAALYLMLWQLPPLQRELETVVDDIRRMTLELGRK